ncbi:MAG: Fic family protein [Campylobacteraceae bacterium]|jgi:fido (protein-threonine AMPylation protein)|nr:Fic family protein [Campylobacteraceae bacterium]
MNETNYDIVQNQYSQKQKSDIWDTAFGLQKVDNLEPSDYMKKQAQQHIENKIEYADIENNIKSYYENSQERSTMEADIVSLRAAELLSRNGFKFSPATLLGIHKYLFTDTLPANIPVGKFRHYNITKKEDVLDGDTVFYDDFGMINDTLEYDFTKESKLDYNVLDKRTKVFNAMNFISNIWQIHPFGEGNTRTIAVFAIKYFRILGFEVDNSLFKEHSKYFRDALVLANYHKIGKTSEYLDKFTENLLLAGKNELEISINFDKKI